jgi:TPR repeat protein
MRKPGLTLVGALMALLVMVSAGVAGPLEDALAAHRRGDYVTAERMLRPLAERGDAKAQNYLASLYSGYQGFLKDCAELMKWTRLAAGQGDAEGQYSLGFYYYNGDCVPQNFVLAHMWLNLSAAQDTDLRTAATMIRDWTERNMTLVQIAEAQKLASEWKPKQ